MNKPRNPRNPRPQLVFAEWPYRTQSWDRLGTRDFGGDSSDSFYLSLRAALPGDSQFWLYRDAQLISELCLWVWLMPASDPDGAPRYSVELRVRELHCATLDTTERLLATMRKLTRKMPAKTGECSFRSYITDVAASLGIKQTIRYLGAEKDTFGSLGDFIEVVCTEFDRRLKRCQQTNAIRRGS